MWPLMLRVESSHEEGGVREWGAATIRFSGDDLGNVVRLHALRVGPPPKFEPLPGSEFELEVDLVLLALGFTGPAPNTMFDEIGITRDLRGTIAANENYMTSVPGVFAAGDIRRGQSLVVWAIAEGRRAAASIDRYLRTRR
jgi:glutamate synthase (NADPH/NADH) small chain